MILLSGCSSHDVVVAPTQPEKYEANGGYITDVKIKESWAYALVGTVYKTTITATVYPKN